ncbi:hypothetical protein [Longitalea luteola]|uniref:hypothetical protein n=1 Tax=Longitalea luteola TaxID=2812563 RepID=UPI001A9714EC|nr:hypothetical protein [Longitalea luteola]
MATEINSYKELLRERARLNALLAEQELLIKEDWRLIKEDLKPAALVATTARRLFTRRGGMTVAQLGINIFADGIVKKVLLGKSGWITRWLIPFFIKNYASHLVGRKGNLFVKVKHLFGKNGKAAQEAGMDAV